MVDMLLPILIGLAVGSILYLGLGRLGRKSETEKKTLAIAAYSIGGVITWWLYTHPDEIARVGEEIFSKGLLILFAFLSTVLVVWKIRSRFF